MTEQGSYAYSIPGVLLLLNWFGVLRTVPTFESMPPDLREAAYGLDWNSRYWAYVKTSIPIDEQREALFMSAVPLPEAPLIVISHGKTDQSPGVSYAEDIALQADRIWLDDMKTLAKETSQGIFIGRKKRSQHPFGTTGCCDRCHPSGCGAGAGEEAV